MGDIAVETGWTFQEIYEHDLDEINAVVEAINRKAKRESESEGG